jgi:acyl carrier protein
MAQFDVNDTFAKVATIIVDTLNIDKAQITPQSSFEALGADSLDMLEIIMKFEDTFGIEINDDDAAHIKTVQEAVEAINRTRTK